MSYAITMGWEPIARVSLFITLSFPIASSNLPNYPFLSRVKSLCMYRAGDCYSWSTKALFQFSFDPLISNSILLYLNKLLSSRTERSVRHEAQVDGPEHAEKAGHKKSFVGRDDRKAKNRDQWPHLETSDHNGPEVLSK